MCFATIIASYQYHTESTLGGKCIAPLLQILLRVVFARGYVLAVVAWLPDEVKGASSHTTTVLCRFEYPVTAEFFFSQDVKISGSFLSTTPEISQEVRTCYFNYRLQVDCGQDLERMQVQVVNWLILSWKLP